jgi:hypothetical protein
MSEAAPSLADAKLPVAGTDEALPHLRRPFTAEAVRWKVQAGTLVVPYIDARLVIERLNLVVGSEWAPAYRPDGRLMWCDLSLFSGPPRSDVGSGYEGKGLVSDSLKRAAVHYGVGVSLYALKKQWLDKDSDFLKAEKKAEKTRYSLTRDGEVHLRETYEGWFPHIESKFGPVLDHGDFEGSYGDVEAGQPAPDSPQPELPAEPEKLTDAKAEALVEAAQKLYGSLTAPQKKGLPKAAFDRALAGAGHSHEELEKFVADLEKRGEK